MITQSHGIIKGKNREKRHFQIISQCVLPLTPHSRPETIWQEVSPHGGMGGAGVILIAPAPRISMLLNWEECRRHDLLLF